MMLVTCALSPATWEAMLPQEFSAATTWTLPDPEAAGCSFNPHAHRSNAATARAVARGSREAR